METQTPDFLCPDCAGDTIWYEDRKIRPIHRLCLSECPTPQVTHIFPSSLGRNFTATSLHMVVMESNNHICIFSFGSHCSSWVSLGALVLLEEICEILGYV